MNNMNKNFIILILFLFSIQTFSQWTELSIGVNVNLLSVSAVDDNTVWVCGSNSNVYRTTNGGSNWINSSGSGMPGGSTLYNIYAVNSSFALVTGISGISTFVCKTTNGGLTWTSVFQQNSAFINAIWMRSSSEGIFVGDPINNYYMIYKTTNEGSNWFSTGGFQAPSNEAGVVNSLYVVGDNVWFGTSTDPRLYYSTNWGASWNPQSVQNMNGVYAIYFLNSLTGMCGGPGGVSITTNSGVNWNMLTYPGTGYVNGISGTSNYWLITKYGRSAYLSMNNGNSWTLEYQAPSNSTRNMGTKSRNGFKFWDVRNDGSVGKRDLPLAVSQNNSQIPTEYQLEQNFPNPFNPVTNIKFNIPNSGNTKMILYDVLGREVLTILEERICEGKYEIQFNGSNLSSAIYYYTLFSGTFRESKKMILIK